MEIKSSLFKSKLLSPLKDNIINISTVDNKLNFRVKMVEYINDTADNTDDEFFYDMVPMIRFLDPASDAIAFTDENHIIYLNSPGNKVGEKIKVWDFIYCHECLHQLWDTFGVRDRIKKDGIEYNHELLNIASDCVINDYLRRIRKKTPFENGIFPEVLKDKFNIDYNPKVDTQYSLYLKLIGARNEQQEKMDDFLKEMKDILDDIDGKIKPKNVANKQGGGVPPPPPSNVKHSKDYIKGWTEAIRDVVKKTIDPLNHKPKSTGNDEYDKGYNDCIKDIKTGLENGIEISDGPTPKGGGGSDLPQIPWDIDKSKDGGGDNDNDNTDSDDDSDGDSDGDSDSDNLTSDDAKNAADKASKAAKEAQENAKSGKISKEDADKSAEAAKEAQEAAKKAKECANKGDKDGESKAAKEAQDAANKAVASSQGKTGNKVSTIKDMSNGPKKYNKESSSSAGSGEGDRTPTGDVDFDEIRKYGDRIIKKHRSKLGGVLGEFINKCKSSANLENEGLTAKAAHGAPGWNTQMDSIVNSFVKTQIFRKKRQIEQTYTRVKRGSGFVKYGMPINPGTRVKRDTIDVSVAFYVDKSGSMSDSIKNVFTSMGVIAESLKDIFGSEKLVEDISFRSFVFDYDIDEIKWGRTCDASGGTMSFDKLLDHINRLTKDYMINIIITDAEFDVDATKVEKLLNSIDGIVLFITNAPNATVENISKKNDNLSYIVATADFDLDD